MGKILIISKSFPPGVGGSFTVMENLFCHINPDEYVVLRDGQEVRADAKMEFAYTGENVNYPSWARFLRRLYPLDIFLMPFIIAKLFQMKKKYGVQRCLIVYPDPFFMVSGYIFALFAKVKYFLYFHDIWTEDELQITDIIKRGLGVIFERPIIKNTAGFFTLTDAMRKFYLKKHGVDSIILPHGINMDLIDPHPAPLSSDKKIKIVYSGIIFESKYTAALVQAIKDQPDIEFTVTSFQSAAVLAKEGIAGPNVKVLYLKDKKDVVALQRQADILYLSQSRDAGYDVRMMTAIPTKLFDYLINLKPVLVHGPKESNLYLFCKEKDLGYPLTSLEKEDILKAIRGLKQGKSHIDRAHILEFLSNYDRKMLSQRLWKVVNQ